MSCDFAISVVEYNALVANPSDVPWYCSRCSRVDSADSTKPGLLNCVYFIVRGIVSKKSDLLVYLNVHHVDVLGISKSFLDFSVLDSEVCQSTRFCYVSKRQRLQWW